MEVYSIYRIDTSHHSLIKFTNHDKIVEFLINKVSNSVKYSNKKKNNNKPINSIKIGEFNYTLFAQEYKNVISKWNDFLPDELKVNIDFNQSTLNILLFASNNLTLFVICGGSAFQKIINYTDTRFGISMISKLLNPEVDSILSIDTREISGKTAKTSTQYKSDLKISNFAKFGKVPTHLLFILNYNSSKYYFSHLGLKLNEEVKIEAGRSLKIKKTLDFTSLHKTFESIEVIYSLAESDYLSSYEKVNKIEFINGHLKPLLIRKLYDLAANIVSTQANYNEFTCDFIHPSKHLEFLTSDYYIIKEKQDEKHIEIFRTTNSNEIFERVLRSAIIHSGNNDMFKFQVYIQGVRVVSYKSNKSKLETSSSFLFFINAEFVSGDKNYFYLDNGWYILKDSFLKDLNISAANILQSKKLENKVLNKPWPKSLKGNEPVYNKSFESEKNYIVFDRMILEGIEMCDLLYYDEYDVYLIHVKYGFNANIRSLSSQVVLSSNRISMDIKSGEFNFIEKIYSKITDSNLDMASFVRLFKENKINYVFAFAGNNDKDLMQIENMKMAKSNIAKYSIIECNQKMIETDFNLYFKQIKHSDQN